MKKFFNIFLTAFAVIFFIPTTLILASWNALPGDTLYSVKTGLEDIALAITLKTPIASAFSIEFTDRRFNEATKLLARDGSTVGYELLVAEAKQTQTIVVDQNDTKNGAELIRKIEKYQEEIQQKQIEVQSQVTYPSPSQVVQKPSTAPSPTSAPLVPTTPTIPKVSPSPKSKTQKTVIVTKSVEVVIEEEEPEVVLENLDETNQELEKIKDEVKAKLPEAASENAVQKQIEKEERNGEKENNKPSEKDHPDKSLLK